MADGELGHAPLHITVVGGKNDPNARALFTSALKYPISYKQVEWWDRGEGALPNSDVEFPDLKRAAAFICASERCSKPAYSAKELEVSLNATR